MQQMKEIEVKLFCPYYHNDFKSNLYFSYLGLIENLKYYLIEPINEDLNKDCISKFLLDNYSIDNIELMRKWNKLNIY